MMGGQHGSQTSDPKMNTSIDDRASQSTNNESETSSSANPQSPRSTSILFNPLTPTSNTHQNYRPNANATNNHLLATHLQQHNSSNQHQQTSFNHRLQQQGYQHEPCNYSTSTNPHSAIPNQSANNSSSNNNNGNTFHHHDLRNLPNQQRPQQATAAAQSTTPLPIKRPYTGVDKLIMAAMIEESAAAAAAATGASAYLPSGRGLGYFGTARDTYAQIPTPSNKSELELYMLLEKANLLNYFGTFLNFGGDDVQQLSDADEDEFLEIMSLVGMTSKPLHVRRLQRALIEWRENKESFDSYKRFQNSLNHGNNGAGNNHTTAAPTTTTNRQLFNTSSASSYLESPIQNSSTTSLSRPLTQANDSYGHQYVLSHGILIGAPKRLRLMDNLLEGYNAQQSIYKSSSNTCDSQQQNETNNQQSINSTENPVDRYITSSPKSQKSVDKEDDKLIEIVDNAESDLELDEDTSKAVCDSPDNSPKIPHSKYGRYRASLQGSSKKPGA